MLYHYVSVRNRQEAKCRLVAAGKTRVNRETADACKHSESPLIFNQSRSQMELIRHQQVVPISGIHLPRPSHRQSARRRMVANVIHDMSKRNYRHEKKELVLFSPMQRGGG